VSAGVASIVPPRDLDVTALLNACKAALQRAKSHGKNRVIAAQAVDFTAPRVAIPARA
jgi:PleD family two-component response regulator